MPNHTIIAQVEIDGRPFNKGIFRKYGPTRRVRLFGVLDETDGTLRFFRGHKKPINLTGLPRVSLAGERENQHFWEKSLV